MTESIQYFFTLISPFAYMGHDKLLSVAEKHGKSISYRPVGLMGVWESSGAVPLPQRPKARQNMRMIELQRWREARGVTLNLTPKHFPTNPVLADRTVIALVEAGKNPHNYARRVFQAVWVNDQDIADRAVIAEALRAEDFDADSVLAAAESSEIEALHAQNTRDGVALEIIGSPAYVWQDEPFWGQDRLELLDAAIASGRGAYQA